MGFNKRCSYLICLLGALALVDCRVVFDDDFSQDDLYEEPLFDEEGDADSFMQRDQPPWQQQARDDLPEPRTEDKVKETNVRAYRECSSPDDCLQDECCHIGMQRYSIPSCQPMGLEGDFCRMGQEPANFTLSYPNGAEKDVVDGHILFCPCSPGLECSRATCRRSGEARLVERSHWNPL